MGKAKQLLEGVKNLSVSDCKDVIFRIFGDGKLQFQSVEPPIISDIQMLLGNSRVATVVKAESTVKVSLHTFIAKADPEVLSALTEVKTHGRAAQLIAVFVGSLTPFPESNPAEVMFTIS